MTHNTGALVRGVILLVCLLGSVGWFVVTSVRKAEDPALMVFKWILTVGVLGILFGYVAPIVARQDGFAAVGVGFTAACGFALAAIWRRSIAAMIAKPFVSLYDGGDAAPDPHPAYSVAQARQKQGKYLEAVTEVRKQLERFPTDVEGQMLLAQIQAENLNDLGGAERTILHFCEQPGHAPENVAFALYSLADWQLSIGKDQDAARNALQKIINLFPGTEFAHGAANRIGHLGSAEMMIDPHERKKFVVTENKERVGLLKDFGHLKPVEVDPSKLAEDYVKQLEEHPQDVEAREQLAILYARHYGRIDLAADQFEQLIDQPGQPLRLVARWLNLLADLQVHSGVDFETVKATVERIIDRDPKAPAADIARNRLALLKLEFKARETKSAVKMGTYETNLGLKGGGPKFSIPRYRPPR